MESKDYIKMYSTAFILCIIFVIIGILFQNTLKDNLKRLREQAGYTQAKSFSKVFLLDLDASV